MHRITPFFCAFFLIVNSVLAIDFSRINVAWQYNLSAPVQMAHRVVTVDDDLVVFLKVKLDSSKWKYAFLLQEKYETEEHREFSPSAIDTISTQGTEILIKLQFGVPKEDLMVIKIFRYETYLYYDIPIKIGSLMYPSVYPVTSDGVPILENHINRSGHYWKNNEYYFSMRYPAPIGIPDPPMADMKPLAPNIQKDSSFTFTDSASFADSYFYTVMGDSGAATGVTMLKVPPYFPEYRQLPELVTCMFYLTSESEKKKLLSSKDLKRDFDSFWVNNFSTKPRARNAIRKYYNSVERANRLFTDFSAGWSTDRGMVYIVYGPPVEVYRTTGLEEWYYTGGSLFEFSVISSFFSPRTYALRRSKAMEEGWYRQIAAIRRGINE
ncbi:MAG: GWxTD domain-containing protein [Bacteroidota bacterium]